jgi:hypothetical protein
MANIVMSSRHCASTIPRVVMLNWWANENESNELKQKIQAPAD